MMKPYKIALVHDLLTNPGGAEGTLAAIYALYPSPIHTLVLDKENLKKTTLKNATIITSFIQRLPWSLKRYRNYLPFYPVAIEQFDLSGYDVIISSSFVVAKGVLTHTEQLHICYLHNPIRAAWELHAEFLSASNNGKGIKGIITRVLFHYLRHWDVLSSGRVDYFVANSLYTAKRIKKIYNRDAAVIYPPVAIELFELEEVKEDYYVTVSRLVYHKRIDIIVRAFKDLPEKRLIVIGTGPELKNLKAMASSNVEFLGYQSQPSLIKYLQKGKAFIFAAKEDFGIAPIEAMACGTPVLAYGKGGVLETVIPGRTGLFFYRQDETGLLQCLLEFELNSDHFNPVSISEHAAKFDIQRFQNEFKEFTERKIEEFFNAANMKEQSAIV